MNQTPATILVVDDNPTNLKLAVAVLESEGYRVVKAKDGEEAQRVIKDAAPDLILMDIALPGMDGLTLTRKLRADPATQPLRIVAMTAFAMKGDEQRAIDAGCNGYIAKPIDTRRLPAQVAEFLQGEPGRPLNVLIVDDTEPTRKLLRVTLQAEGLNVFEAGDGVEALAVLERQPIDAIISDVLMPTMDGYRLCYEVRKSEWFHSLPFIFYTNTNTSPGDEKLAADLGANKFLIKPASAQTLLDALVEVTAHLGGPRPPVVALPQELELMKQYSSWLVAMLEEQNAELVRVDALLRESEMNFRAIVEHGGDAFFLMNAEGTVRLASPPTLYNLGYSAAEFVGRNAFEFVHPDDQPAMYSLFVRLLQEPGSEVNCEIRGLHRDGSWRWLDAIGRNRLSDPNLAAIVVSYRDVTERKQADAALRQSEEFSRRIIESSYDCIKVLDLDGNLLSMSEGGQRLLGITDITPYLNQCWISFWQASDQPQVREAVAAGRAGNIGHFQAFCPSATGEPRWWDVIVSAIRDAAGQPYQLLSSSRDITERKQAEITLRESNERHRTLFDVSPVGKCITRFADGVFLDVNEAFVKFTGHTREELLGRSSHELNFWLDPEDRAKLVQALANNGSVRDWEVGFRRKDGSLGHSLRSLERLTLHGEDCILTVLSDITERKRNEEELRVSRERLETLSRQLIATQESERRHLALELHDEIGQELTSIKLNLKTMEPSLPAEADLLHDTLSIADQALQQVRSLALDLRPSMLDDIGLAAALRWCLDRQARRSGFTPHFLAEPAEIAVPPEIAITCFRVAQESLTNIARHAQARNVRVEVRQYETAIDLQVQDDGIGFDVTAATDQATHGASLGLLGMRERAELVGGLIDIESNTTTGTTIHARFPLKQISGSDQ